MNKLKILFVLSIIFFSFNSVYATSGACSYHEGVNCLSGASYTGKVQCNDGWINSSVNFSDAIECQKPSCVYPTYSSCDVEQAKQQAQQRAQNRSFSVGGSGGNRTLLDWTQDSNYILCKDTQALYQIGQDNYNKCLSDESEKLKKENTNLDKEYQIKFNAVCVKYNGLGSVWDSSLPSDINNPPCTKATIESGSTIQVNSKVQSSEEWLKSKPNQTPLEALRASRSTKFITASEYLANQKKPSVASSAKTPTKTGTVVKNPPIDKLNITIEPVAKIITEPVKKISWHQKFFNWLFK